MENDVCVRTAAVAYLVFRVNDMPAAAPLARSRKRSSLCLSRPTALAQPPSVHS